MGRHWQRLSTVKGTKARSL